MLKRIFALICCSFLAAGCATMSGKTVEMKHFQKENYQEDWSTGITKGKVLIKSTPPSQQLAVRYYVVIIDNNDYVQVSKHSDLEIWIDPGEHNLEIFAVPSVWKGFYGDVIGKPSNAKFTIKENDLIIYEYSGPFWMWSEGKLERVI